jgi:hypothetical protein
MLRTCQFSYLYLSRGQVWWIYGQNSGVGALTIIDTSFVKIGELTQTLRIETGGIKPWQISLSGMLQHPRLSECKI